MSRRRHHGILILSIFIFLHRLNAQPGAADPPPTKAAAPHEAVGPVEKPNGRRPADEAELRYWLRNMVWHHGFTDAEISAATGLTEAEVRKALKRLDITPANKPKRPADAPLLVLPYPGGRHPRIGFQEGAIRPQRETKLSVFTPWDETSYVVVDVPEAVWSNLGLLYLAHTHVPTLWTKKGIELDPLEWNRRGDGSLDIERRLPNGVAFGAKIVPTRQAVRMELWLTNGGEEPLADLRVQNCVLLKSARGFEARTNDNKIFRGPYAACRSADGRRWIITAWTPFQRGWANDKCPCLHSDPKFPDCAPGETQRLSGWLSFHEGADIEAELGRIEQTGWSAGLKKEERPVRLRGEVVDADTGGPIPSRVYIRSEDGTWFFPRSESASGSAVAYRKQRADNPRCAEMHTTLSAHPFVVDLPSGRYTITIERGKEYRPLVRQIIVGREPIGEKFALERWINMAQRGWYSGDTHVHRGLEELPNVLLAEDLNVAFPLVHWVTEAFVAPRSNEGRLDARVLPVDATHVIYPRNTEYEIFTVDKQRHTLGAFFVLNHRTVLAQGVPPIKGVVEQARREGGLIEMDKHNWPWSMALAAIVQPDLYELANNHVWRTEFGFPAFGEPAPEYMGVERTPMGFTEWGWIDYGFQNYYALLNCGFRPRPTAGTASGVHPVPLGFGRVYVHCREGFGYEAWLRGLKEGNSFVTTGPMLFVQVDGRPPGHTFRPDNPAPHQYAVTGSVISELPLDRIEIVVNGEVIRTLKPANRKGDRQAHENPIDERVTIDGSAWLAVRCFESRPQRRVRFAHSAPFHVEAPQKPLRPKRAEIEFLIKRVEDQIARSGRLLPEAALAEYREAARIYRQIGEKAR